MFWKLYGVLLALGIVVPAGFVVVGFVYGQQQLALMSRHDDRVLMQMKQRDVAFAQLQLAKEYVAYLDEVGLSSDQGKQMLVEIQDAFAQERYAEVQVDAVLTEVALVEQKDEKQKLQLSSQLEQLAIEVADAKKQGVTTKEIEPVLEMARTSLVERKYNDVVKVLAEQKVVLAKVVEDKKKVDEEARKKALAAANVATTVAAQNNGGITYERKGVVTPKGTFTTDVLRIDMSRSWVRTFVAHDGDCSKDCVVKPLASYVGENGGVAGINGSYFCPPDYAQCAERKNSFDLLVFDYRTKKYSNSGNNQYSTNPLINFYPGRANLYGQALGFGRDSGANGVISNFPLLINNGTVVGGDTGKGTRGAIGFANNIAWAVIVRGASFQDTAFVLQSLGANNGMNLDGGGSSALYFSGYKVGPGRALPNAIVFGN